MVTARRGMCRNAPRSPTPLHKGHQRRNAPMCHRPRAPHATSGVSQYREAKQPREGTSRLTLEAYTILTPLSDEKIQCS